ncbi:MAG TPA: Ig-like domain-containing protein [Kofleriaceae bacterium]|nr:Ig-like domain-containing protein [Kofleriaceae bacterium]
MRRISWLVAISACGFSGGNDSKPPTVVSVSPGDGADGVWLHDPITVTFSEAIDPASVTATSVVVTADDGTPLAATATLTGAVLTVQVADDAAAVGAVRLTLSNAITDMDANPLAETSVGWTLPAWSRAATTGATPSLAIGDGGRVVVAWSAGANSARRVVVNQIGPAGFVALGGELGAGDSALPSITFDAQDRPIVVWSQFGATASVQAARWDGDAWVPLASPGDGAYAVAARSPGGDPMIAYVAAGSFQNGSAVVVRRLVDDAWQPLGTDARDIAVIGTVSGLPQLAMATPDTPVVAFADTGATGTSGRGPAVRVLRWTGTWIETTIPIGVPVQNGSETTGAFNRVAVAAHGDTIDVAYDTYSGFSWGVHVARVDAQGYHLLGGELDVDSPADAQAPAIALDADGTPIVAWRELVEGNWRGFVARWDGTAWRAVGGGAWNDDAAHAIVRPVMALAGGRAPVIAWGAQSVDSMSASATIAIARWNGPAVPRFGIEARTSITGCAFDGTQTTLSATGCFTIANGRATPHAGLIPFDIVSELWSDGARKRRWIALPDGEMMTTQPTGAWTPPAGAMLIKEFAIETTPGDPRTRRVMETRFLIVGASSGVPSLQGYSFRWRIDGSDADLLPDAATTVDWPLDNGTLHTHSYPSRAQCLRCHNVSNGPLLGVRTGQLARRFDYDGVMGDQLDTLAHIGAIAPQLEVQPFASPHDATLPLETRMRGYVAANCSHCHNPGGERPTRDFRWEVPLAQTKLCGTDAEVVAGDPASSVIFQRISTRVNGMPPLATLQTDPLAIDVIGRWIQSEVNCQ